MKEQTIINRLEKGGFLRKDGMPKAVAYNATFIFEKMSRGMKFRPFYWRNNYTKLEGKAKYDNVTRLLLCLRIPYVDGNDAPRGGITGNYVEIKKGARKRLAEIVNIIRNEEIWKS